MHTISCIGAGNMGSALVRGLIQSGAFHPDSVKVFDVDRAKTLSLHQDFGVQPLERLEDSVADRATVLVLAVKPQVLSGVLDTLSTALHEGALVISIAGGIFHGVHPHAAGQEHSAGTRDAKRGCDRGTQRHCLV